MDNHLSLFYIRCRTYEVIVGGGPFSYVTKWRYATKKRGGGMPCTAEAAEAATAVTPHFIT